MSLRVPSIKPVWFLGAIALALIAQPLFAAQAGTIAGTIDNPGQVKAVVAVNRDTDKKYPGKVDASSGKFTIENLPLGCAYDCQIDFGEARLEGINLKVKRSDYEEEQPLAKEDVEAIKETTLSLNKFEDQVDVITVQGNIQHAAVLINKVRTKPFINSKPGEVVWRLELWHYERPEETWVKEQDELFLVLYRERIQKDVFVKKSLTLDASVGGLQPTAKQPTIDVGLIQLPSKEPGIRLRANKGIGTASK